VFLLEDGFNDEGRTILTDTGRREYLHHRLDNAISRYGLRVVSEQNDEASTKHGNSNGTPPVDRTMPPHLPANQDNRFRR
jgi:hypothetical protein